MRENLRPAVRCPFSTTLYHTRVSVLGFVVWTKTPYPIPETLPIHLLNELILDRSDLLSKQ